MNTWSCTLHEHKNTNGWASNGNHSSIGLMLLLWLTCIEPCYLPDTVLIALWSIFSPFFFFQFYFYRWMSEQVCNLVRVTQQNPFKIQFFMSSSQRFTDYSTPRNSTLVKPHCNISHYNMVKGTGNILMAQITPTKIILRLNLGMIRI